jgi:YbbR domain-containing protein
VTIRAPNRMINEVTPANVLVKLNLSKASVVQQEYPLNETMVSLPPGAEVVRLSPNKVRLKLERTQEVMLDIVPTIIGQAKEGYGVSKIEITPPRVLVKGPESKVRRNEKVTTSPIDISPLTSSTEIEADIILPRPELRLASPKTRVSVKIFLEEIKASAKAEPRRKE